MADKPNTPAKADTKKPMTFAEFAAMTVADLAVYCKKIVRVDQAIVKARDAFTKGLKQNAKAVAALKRAHAAKRDTGEIPGDWDFKKYFKNVAGGDLPGRVEAMAALFNSLVLTLDANQKPLLPEEYFDAAKDDWLEKANAVIKAAQKQYGDPAWKTCDDVLDVINALSKPGDAAKKIKEIRARQKGEGDEESAEQPLTVGRAVEFLKAAIKNGGNMLAAGKKDEVFDLYVETFRLTDHWIDSGIPDEILNKWTEQLESAEKNGHAPHLEVLKPAAAEQPAPTQPAALAA